ncbi:MAG: SDR family oxidoreductase [Phormidesmis sp.]
MKAAIIGCGYVGKCVAKRWKEQGLEVLGTTTSPERVSELKPVLDHVEVLKGTDAQKLRVVLGDRTTVLLCVSSKRGSSYSQTYLSTAQTLAEVLPDTPVEQLIYTSTCSVYGQQGGVWVTETMPPTPATENGKIIEATEQTLLAATTPQRKICILRLGGIYGPGRTVEDIYACLSGKTLPGKGEEGANWVHLSDIVGAIDWARQRQLAGIYNVVQDEIPTRRELIDQVCDRANLAPITWDETQPSSRPHNVRISNTKLKSTGFQLVHPTFWPQGD